MEIVVGDTILSYHLFCKLLMLNNVAFYLLGLQCLSSILRERLVHCAQPENSS